MDAAGVPDADDLPFPSDGEPCWPFVSPVGRTGFCLESDSASMSDLTTSCSIRVTSSDVPPPSAGGR